MVIAGRTRRTLVAVLIPALVMAVPLALALVFGLASQSDAQTPATPQCPAGTTFNAATGACEAPATTTEQSVCPPGSTYNPDPGFFNDAPGCVAPKTNGACPAGFGDFFVPPNQCGAPAGSADACAPFTGATCFTCPAGATFDATTGTCTGAPVCPPGTTGPTNGICTAQPTFVCPPGTTLVGTLCFPPEEAPEAPTTAVPVGCPAGTTPLSFGLGAPVCFPIGGTAGDADASGGDGGSARGGDGGRGGSGTLPVCNQNTNGDVLVQVVDDDGYVVDEYYEAAEPSLDCEAGARGGNAGDAGISEGGDAGLAFSVG